MGKNILVMRFLRLFWTTLKGFIHHKFLDSLVDNISPQEDLTRYLLSSNQFSPSNKRVKSSAFLPPQNLKLSVFRIKDLSNVNIWKIGTDKVANRINPPKPYMPELILWLMLPYLKAFKLSLINGQFGTQILLDGPRKSQNAKK